MQLWDFHTHQSGKECAIFNHLAPFSWTSSPCSMGIHPWYLDLHWEQKLIQIQAASQTSDQVVAIGEAGFDRIKGPEISLQKGAFYAQARWASALDIPLILHCVKGHDLLLEYLKSEKNPPAIIWHGWNQKPELAKQLLSFPVYFSFGKHLLQEHSNATEWLKGCPIDRLFFETDDSGLEIDSIYRAASLILRLPVEKLARQAVFNWNTISKRKIR
ncbi:TatD family hydrolase [Algoriphagus aquatilis]|uniref:TatD family hydrolase n=1 Tax=Algoriphagus aquatilis TaxID=490186 RepID=A0ABW0BUC5_9BACT|nr:TatD family hydrolase [Algoriphagus sp.]